MTFRELKFFNRLVYLTAIIVSVETLSGCKQTSDPKSAISEQEKPIAYVSLTNESTHPFANGDPKFTVGQKSAIANFPSVRDCLIDEEQGKMNPDLRFLKWDEMKTLEDAEVCMWRIFTSYEDPKKIFSWFSFHGAKSNMSVEDLETDPITNISVRPLYFSWPISSNKLPISRPIYKKINVHSLGVSVPLTLSSHEIINVSAKWTQSF